MKIVAFCLLLAFSTSLVGTQTNYPPIVDTDLPVWVPSDKEIREHLLVVFNSAIELVNIKESPYQIVSARQKDGWVYVTVKRHTLMQEIKVGKFEQVKDVRIEGGTLRATYQTTKEPDWRMFGYGAGAGVVLVLLIYGLTR